MYGLLGEKLGHSYSKIIHEKLGYEYELIEKRADELSSFILDGNFDGLNVTIPYKKTVMQYCEHLTPLAQRIGAVNTLYFDTSGLIGTNTDYEGLRFDLERAGIDLSGRKVLILGGTGGAGSMARILSEDLGAREIVIASRGTYSQNKLPDTPTEDRISSNISFVAYDDLPQDAEIIINATPVGTYPNITDSPADLSDFDNCVGVCDLIYNPLRTELLIQAKELGIRYTNGLPMLVRQAAAAAEYFHKATSAKAGIFLDRTEAVLSELLNETENIVLIGMPGCGKSTIGRILAKKTGRNLKDTDKTIREMTGRTPAEIITSYGEEEFRRIESEAVLSLSREHSLIIATGGGVVMREQNVRLLKQNGRIFFIDRDPDKLSTYNRPLSQNGGVFRIYRERFPVYSAVSDERVENNGRSFAPCADKILRIIGT